jgi:rSAM/selenodomain-associated transferase 1
VRVKDWSRNLLGVFAKQPIAGQVKTRLAAATSPEFAERVACAFLEDTLDRAAAANIVGAVVFTPSSARSFFEQIVAGRFELIPQAEGDLGNRLRAFFGEAGRLGFERIVVMGTDSPTLPIDSIQKAFQSLEENDVVIAPAFDGGYCLLGVTAKDVDLFSAIPWSTPRVLAATIARAQAAGATLALLPAWYDVDTLQDWQMLCGHVKAMRLAGIDPPARVERLVDEGEPPPVIHSER